MGKITFIKIPSSRLLFIKVIRSPLNFRIFYKNPFSNGPEFGGTMVYLNLRAFLVNNLVRRFLKFWGWKFKHGRV